MKLMNKPSQFLLCASMGVLLALPSTGLAKAPVAEPPGAEFEGVCIDQGTLDRVTSCPAGIDMGKRRKKASAKVGTSTVRKDKPEKKEVDEGPGLDRAITKNIIEGSFRKKREKKKIDFINREIQLIQRLIQTTPDDNPDKAEIHKRLADAYKEFYDLVNFMARELDEKIFLEEKKGNKQKAAKFKAQQKALDAKAVEYQEKAIREYVAIRNNFPDYENYDEILFAIAYEIDQMAVQMYDDKERASQYRERARVFYQELIRNYPTSPFIPHSWMSFGEYYFHEAKDVERAMRSYEKVVEWGEENNPNYIIAMYYQAWCFFNLQDFEATIDQFVRVILYAKDNPENREAKAVAKRARMELVDAYSKIEDPRKAWDFFQKYGGKLAHKMLVKLADIYFSDGLWEDAVTVYRKLQSLEIENYLKNNGDDICYYQTQVTNAAIASRSKGEQTEELRRQLNIYKKYSSEKHDADKLKKCASDTAMLAWDQATQWHVEAVGSESAPGTGDRDTMELTIALYNTILETFPNLDKIEIDGYDAKTRPTNYRVAYYKADLYYKLRNWEKCGPAFDAVVDLDPAGEYTTDAAYAAVLCYDSVYKQRYSDKSRKRKHQLHASADGKAPCDKKCKACRRKCKGKDRKACFEKCETAGVDKLAPRELDQLEQGILRSYDRYVCFVGKGDQLVQIKYRRARIYYEANMFPEASIIFKDIAVNHSSHDLALYSANLYLDCLNVMTNMMDPPRKACLDDLVSIIDVFIDNDKAPGKHLMKDEMFASQMKTLKVGVLRQKAEQLTKTKRFKESAELYINIFKNYGEVYDDSGMCEVLYNAAINMEAARLVMPAIKVRQKMIADYETCKHTQKAAYFIGQNYHALQAFRLAALNYEKFAKKYPKAEESPLALSNAVTFYIGLGMFEEAWKAVSTFEKKYKASQPQRTATVFFSTGYIYVNDAKESGRDNNKWELVRNHYERYLKKYKRAKSIDEQVQANVFIGDSYWKSRPSDFDKALKYYNRAISLFDKGGMDKVAENARKASMLIATAKARYQIAERKFHAFRRIKFPEFTAHKDLPKKIEKWWKKKTPKAERDQQAEWRKQRRNLARWGYWEEGKPIRAQVKAVKKEEKKERAQIQFNYWLEKKFVSWMEKKSEVLDEATKLYAKVAGMHVPEWEMAAAARAADMQLEFMQSLYDAPIPPSLKGDQELIDIYRGAMDEKAKPFRDTAVGLYAHCLNVSTKVRWFNTNSLRCERELSALEPRQYPMSEEIRVQPENEVVRFAPPEPITDLSLVKLDEEEDSLESAVGAAPAAGEAAAEEGKSAAAEGGQK